MNGDLTTDCDGARPGMATEADSNESHRERAVKESFGASNKDLIAATTDDPQAADGCCVKGATNPFLQGDLQCV